MSRIQPKTQRSIIAHKSTCVPSGSIPRTGYTKKHSSTSWSVSDDTRGNLPQRTALFDSSLGICGRADTTLSTIIIGDGRAAEQIPHDAQGRFLMEDGTVFQAYYFNDATLK